MSSFQRNFDGVPFRLRVSQLDELSKTYSITVDPAYLKVLIDIDIVTATISFNVRRDDSRLLPDSERRKCVSFVRELLV